MATAESAIRGTFSRFRLRSQHLVLPRGVHALLKAFQEASTSQSSGRSQTLGEAGALWVSLLFVLSTELTSGDRRGN